MGHYKLIEWYEGTLLHRGPAVSLFDLVNDPGESHDLAAMQPERVALMQGKLAAWRREVRAQEMTVRAASAVTSPR